jgi:hypothetical protein
VLALRPLQHAGQQGAGQLNRRHHVELRHLAFALRRILGDRTQIAEPRIVDQEIDLLAFREADHRLPPLRRRQIGGDGAHRPLRVRQLRRQLA